MNRYNQGIAQSLLHMIPGSRFEPLSHALSPDSQAGGPVKEEGDGSILLYLPGLSANANWYRVSRQHPHLSAHEQSMIALIPGLIEDLAKPVLLDQVHDLAPSSFLAHALRFTNKIGFGDLLVARFLDHSGQQEGNFLEVLAVLQDLSFRYYEDKRCSSGIYVTSDPEGFAAIVGKRNWKYTPFTEPQSLTQELYTSPAAHRYVDGRNSYYVVDPILTIHGIIRLIEPDSYNLTARLRNHHLGPILVDMPGEPWVAFVGLREEIFAVVTPDLQFKWSKNHWQTRDRALVFHILEEFGVTPSVQELMVGIFFALSESGLGASILIPDNPDQGPATIGKIDHSPMGNALRNMIQSSTIQELSASNALLGILASDGLTTISKDGTMMSCGDIIDITKAAETGNQGGGRSQAAIAASWHGLSIKVSQNGPLSFYHQGRLLLQF